MSSNNIAAVIEELNGIINTAAVVRFAKKDYSSTALNYLGAAWRPKKLADVHVGGMFLVLEF